MRHIFVTKFLNYALIFTSNFFFMNPTCKCAEKRNIFKIFRPFAQSVWQKILTACAHNFDAFKIRNCFQYFVQWRSSFINVTGFAINVFRVNFKNCYVRRFVVKEKTTDNRVNFNLSSRFKYPIFAFTACLKFVIKIRHGDADNFCFRKSIF